MPTNTLPPEATDLIRKYFTSEYDTGIHEYMEPLLIKFDNYFVQIQQEDNLPKLEFSCFNNEFLYDFTYKNHTGVATITALDEIHIISIEQSRKHIEVIMNHGEPSIWYKATNPKYIKLLKEYLKTLVPQIKEAKRNG